MHCQSRRRLAKGGRMSKHGQKRNWAFNRTCKRVTRKDFIYLSPQLQSMMRSVHNSFDRFPDHSTLYALLAFPSKPPPIPKWRRPGGIDYELLGPTQYAQADCLPLQLSGTPSNQYEQIYGQTKQRGTNVAANPKRSGENTLQGNDHSRSRSFEAVKSR